MIKAILLALLLSGCAGMAPYGKLHHLSCQDNEYRDSLPPLIIRWYDTHEEVEKVCGKSVRLDNRGCAYFSPSLAVFHVLRDPYGPYYTKEVLEHEFIEVLCKHKQDINTRMTNEREEGQVPERDDQKYVSRTGD